MTAEGMGRQMMWLTTQMRMLVALVVSLAAARKKAFVVWTIPSP